MFTNREIQQKTLAVWDRARSFNEIRAQNQFYMEQSRDGNYCVAPYNLGPMTDEQCQHIDTLMRLQSYGIIALGGVDPTGIHWEQVDGEYIHTRFLSDFAFLISYNDETMRFLDKIKADDRLNKQVRDCYRNTDICLIEDGPITIQRRAQDMKQLHKQPFTVLEGVNGTMSLEDHGLGEIGIFTSVGVYLCRVMLKIDQDEFIKGSDSSVAQVMQNLHLLQTIENYAQQTLNQTENVYILPPYTSLGSQDCILDELDWNISKAPETATHMDGNNVILSKKVFSGPVKLLLPNRYLEIGEEEWEESPADEVEIRVDGGSLYDILLAIQQQVGKMDAAAGEHQHGDKLLFEGLQRLNDQTWGVDIC